MAARAKALGLICGVVIAFVSGGAPARGADASGAGDENIARITAQGWRLKGDEGKGKTTALLFLYKKKNDHFIVGEKLGADLMKRIEERHFGLRGYHISDNVAEIR